MRGGAALGVDPKRLHCVKTTSIEGAAVAGRTAECSVERAFAGSGELFIDSGMGGRNRPWIVEFTRLR